eukprot:TRINITY_DN7957_c0_g2_i3.p1 TRINITY_DN7957_c0_g2~~TRINITY_DN7957_c0_g2_i3.p1  ORF type:complete len:215 (+),score=9.67 TRINITY_DN7957_c0_g2_i3:48-692(+)
MMVPSMIMFVLAALMLSIMCVYGQIIARIDTTPFGGMNFASVNASFTNTVGAKDFIVTNSTTTLTALQKAVSISRVQVLGLSAFPRGYSATSVRLYFAGGVKGSSMTEYYASGCMHGIKYDRTGAAVANEYGDLSYIRCIQNGHCINVMDNIALQNNSLRADMTAINGIYLSGNSCLDISQHSKIKRTCYLCPLFRLFCHDPGYRLHLLSQQRH